MVLKKISPALLIISLYLHSGCQSGSQKTDGDKIVVSSDFDSGGIGELVQSEGNTLTGPTIHWKHKTSTDDQYYWFHFRLDNVLNKTVTINLNNLIGVYRSKPHLIYTKGTHPVYSYDKVNWERINDVDYDASAHVLKFSNHFTNDSVWIAYAHPYPYYKETEFISSLPVDNSYLKTEIIGSSAQSRNINLLTITDSSVPDKNKKVVLITSLQHAGEYVGGFFVEGMVKYLLSDDARAAEARKKTIYKIVPMMNPDGIYNGMTRLNGNLEDLNQEWDDDYTDTAHAPTEPEVAAVKKWIRDWLKSGKKITLSIDVHSQGQEGSMNLLHAPEGVLDGFAEKSQKYWPIKSIPMIFPGSATECLFKEFKIPAGTYEIPQSKLEGENAYLTIEDYHNYGKGTVLGIADYLFP